ncbi:FitA-like ribbon-helix-helix domain-containing protein [Brevundimonas sp. VNH65]|uniref:FitA-like ribbon-helix-helix domain-containing protein n=1 Tax=Brevundimonas sp. VNH65 TaxID=3400917 RepID=UPI003C107560
MPVNLHVRNVDDDIALALKKRAQANGQSAEAEHREILRRALAPRIDSEWERRAAALREATKGRLTIPSEILIREDRDSR